LSFHGLLRVTVAIPPVTSVRTARSLLFDMGLGSRVDLRLLAEKLRVAGSLSMLGGA
jgi:hypothetical protein